MSFVIAIVQALVIMALAPLVSGMARVIRAKMHTRKGPSIFQDYYDIAKLFKRQDVHPADSSFIHRITPAVYLGVMLVLAMGIPMFTTWSPVPILGDIIVILYLMALARFFFSLATLDSADAYAGVGGLRLRSRSFWPASHSRSPVMSSLASFRTTLPRPSRKSRKASFRSTPVLPWP